MGNLTVVRTAITWVALLPSVPADGIWFPRVARFSESSVNVKLGEMD